MAREGAEDQLSMAIRVAADAHSGQTYPSPKPEPYILHPLRVMFAVRASESCGVVAVLHDVVEDTALTLAELEALGFDEVVVRAVDRLTHRQEMTYETYIERVASDRIAATVKLADIEDNTRNNRLLARTDEVDRRLERYAAAHQRLTSLLS